MFKSFSLMIGLALLFASSTTSNAAPELYGEVHGKIIHQGAKPKEGISITLKPTAYGYGTHDYRTVTDTNGKYVINNVVRYVYSSGSAPKWVNYYLSISAPGYNSYTGSPFNLEAEQSVEQDIKLHK
jgi:hypothetical protein